MDLLELYQIRLDKCASEQFWAIALLGTMNGFIISKKQLLRESLGETLLKSAITLATLLGLVYIISRHFIYLYYDTLINQIITQKSTALSLPPPVTEGFLKQAALWSGVSFYSIIALAMAVASWKTVSTSKGIKMDEAYLRQWHRTMGVILALFLFLQAASGTLMALEFALGSPGLFGALTSLHFGGGFWGQIYRILLGLGLMGMAASGTLIFLKIRARRAK